MLAVGEAAGGPPVQFQDAHRSLTVGQGEGEQRVHPQLCCVSGKGGPTRRIADPVQLGVELRLVIEIGVEARPFADGVLQFIELLRNIVSRIRELAALGDAAQHGDGHTVDPRGPQHFRTQGVDTGEQWVHPRAERLVAASCESR